MLCFDAYRNLEVKRPSSVWYLILSHSSMLKSQDVTVKLVCFISHYHFKVAKSFSVLCSGRLGYVRQWAEWRRAGEKEKNFTGTAGCTLMMALLQPLIVFVHFDKHAFPSVLVWLYCSVHMDCLREHHHGNVLHWAYTLTWLLIWYQEADQLINL